MAARAAAAEFFSSALVGQQSTGELLAAALDDVPEPPMPLAGSVEGKLLRQWVLRQYKVAKMTAEQVCTLSWFATKAGATGLGDLQLDPSRRDQAEHLRRVLEIRQQTSFYRAEVPMWNKEVEQMHHVSFPFALPHESFVKQFELTRSAFDPALHDGSRLSPLYRDHEVTRLKGPKACPVGYFSDAVPHTNRDSFIAFYWSSIISGERFLICSLRKQDLCRCGCKGFCTLRSVMSVISWSFNCLAAGTWPEVRHDGSGHSEGTDRFELRGNLLADGYCGAMCELRADLSEMVSALGFATPWAPGVPKHPCFLCDCPHNDLFNFPVDMNMNGVYPLRDAAEYNSLVAQAVTTVTIESQDLLDVVRGLLHYDGRVRDGPGPGLVLREAVDELDLPKHARLIEAHDLQDISRRDDLVAPVTLSFFDSRGNHGLAFITPFFSIKGFTLEAVHLDVMHVFDLGVSQYLVGAVFREVIDSNFDHNDHVYREMQRFESLKELRRLMAKYYKEAGRDRGSMSQINRLTPGMLGPINKPRLHSKAAECRHLIPFCVQLARDHPNSIPALLRNCIRQLSNFYTVMSAEDRDMSPTGLHILQTSVTIF